MEKLFLLIVMFASCNAEPKDLSGKVFVFPTENSDYVQILTPSTNFSAATVCLRCHICSDSPKEYTLFSLQTSEHNHAFVLEKTTGEVIRMQVQGWMTHFNSLSVPPNTWHSLCATWRSDNGLAQLMLDTKPTIKRYIRSGQPISGTPTTILGLNTLQRRYQPFIGMISEVHMWDYVLSATQLRNYMDYWVRFTPGNVLNWTSLEYELKGQVLVD